MGDKAEMERGGNREGDEDDEDESGTGLEDGEGDAGKGCGDVCGIIHELRWEFMEWRRGLFTVWYHRDVVLIGIGGDCASTGLEGGKEWVL